MKRPTAYEFILIAVGGAFVGCLITHEDVMAIVLLVILIATHFYEFVFAPDSDPMTGHQDHI